MPIRALDFLLQDKKLIREAPLSALRDTRLGIDAQVYLRGVLTAKDAKEPLLPALGGVPLALEEHVTNDMRLLEAARIKPVLVFNGITPPRSERPFSTEDTRPGKRQSGWDAYEKGKVEAATGLFSSVPLTPQDVTRTAQRAIIHRRTEFITAPYLAWAQLAYLERSPKKYTHATWSSTEFLLFDGTERLVLNIDLKAQTFTFISKKEVLQELNLTRDQFLDVGIMSGFESASSIPLPEWSLQGIVDLVKRNITGLQAISATAAKHPSIAHSGYPESFVRARSLIKYSLVTSADGGKVMPLPMALPASAESADAVNFPKDLHEVFSQKLPDELYYQMFRGLVSSQVLGPFASGVWVEHVPLCGGESDEYRRFLRDIITEHPQSPRCTALGLLSSCLEPYWQSRPVHAIYYFDPSNNYPIVHDSPAVAKSLERLLHWNVPLSVITEELRRQGSSTLDFRLCLAATTETTVTGKPYPNRTRVRKDPDRPLEKKDEIVANTLWRFLELRGFLTSSHSQTPHGKALHRGLIQSRINDKFQEPLYLAIELIRAGVLHSGKYGNKTWSGGPNLGGEGDKINAMLIMRVLSIVSLHFKAEAWTGPVSRSLLVFNSFVRTLSRSLRGLLEATTVNMLLKGDAVRNREDFAEISINLPFRSDVNTGMGVLFKGWCDACSMVGTQQGYDSAQNLGGFVSVKADITPEAAEERRENLEEVKTAVAEMLEEGFNSIRDVRSELARGVRFWDTVMVAVRVLHEEKSTLPVDWYLQFEAANRWLEPFRP